MESYNTDKYFILSDVTVLLSAFQKLYPIHMLVLCEFMYMIQMAAILFLHEINTFSFTRCEIYKYFICKYSGWN